jgi:hypothetical protein
MSWPTSTLTGEPFCRTTFPVPARCSVRVLSRLLELLEEITMLTAERVTVVRCRGNLAAALHVPLGQMLSIPDTQHAPHLDLMRVDRDVA